MDGSVGWNQEEFTDWSMYDGGCAAVTACDLSIFLARKKRFSALYPYDPFHVRREDYLAFSEEMKPYLRPRWQGIDTLELYLDGLSAYWRDRGAFSLRGSGIPGTVQWQQAGEMVRTQIDAGFLIPCLLLYHRKSIFQEFQWHWFNIAGYENAGDEMYVKAITYGRAYRLNFREMWDTGYRRKGGLIKIEIQ